MRTLNHSLSKCYHPILRPDADRRLQGHPTFAGESSSHSQNRRYRQFLLIFGGVCASLHVLLLRFITDVKSVRFTEQDVLFTTRSRRFLPSRASQA